MDDELKHIEATLQRLRDAIAVIREDGLMARAERIEALSGLIGEVASLHRRWLAIIQSKGPAQERDDELGGVA